MSMFILDLQIFFVDEYKVMRYTYAYKKENAMGIKYYKLFDLLNRKGMKKTDLRQVLSTATIAKLSKGEYISGEAIEKICVFLHCQPGDIMEVITVEANGNRGVTTYTTKEAEHYSTDIPVNVTATNIRDTESGELYHKHYELDEDTE